MIAPVIVIERRGAIDSFGRSRELVRGHGWQVFSVIVVLFLLQFIITAVLNAIANSVSDSFVGYTISDLIVRVLVAPFTALAAAVLFFELKALRGEPVLGTGARRPDRADGRAGRRTGADPGGADHRRAATRRPDPRHRRRPAADDGHRGDRVGPPG